MSSSPTASVHAIHGAACGDKGGTNAYQQWLDQQEEQQQLDANGPVSAAASNPSAFSTSSLPGISGALTSSGSSIGTDPIEKDFDFTPQQAHLFIENVMSTITSQIKQDGGDMSQAIQKIGSDDPNSGIFN